jgi:glyoxylase-like metal-dependent hydrolase (beta-lactamase superfamily II)
MIHYLYLGHFDHDGGFIRFEKRGDTKPVWHRPVVVRPLDSSVIAELLDERGFVKRLALRTGCDVADYTSLSLLSPDDLWRAEPRVQTDKPNDASAARAVPSKSSRSN